MLSHTYNLNCTEMTRGLFFAANLHTCSQAWGCSHSCHCCRTWLCWAGELCPPTGSWVQLKAKILVRFWLFPWSLALPAESVNEVSSWAVDTRRLLRALMRPHPAGSRRSRRAAGWSWRSRRGTRTGRSGTAAAGWSGWRRWLSVASPGGLWSHSVTTPASYSWLSEETRRLNMQKVFKDNTMDANCWDVFFICFVFQEMKFVV